MGSSGCQPNPQQHVPEVLFPNQLSETEKHPKDFWEGESSISPCFLAHHHWTQPPWNNTISTQKPWRSTEKFKHLYVHCCHVSVTPNSSGTWENIQKIVLPSDRRYGPQSEMRQNCTKQVRSKWRAGSGLLTSWQGIHLLDFNCPGCEHSEAHLGVCPLAALAGLSLPYRPSRSARVRVLFLLCSPREEKHRWWGRGGKGSPPGSWCCLLQGTATALSDKWKCQVFCVHKQGSEMICLTSAQHSYHEHSQTLICLETRKEKGGKKKKKEMETFIPQRSPTQEKAHDSLKYHKVPLPKI